MNQRVWNKGKFLFKFDFIFPSGRVISCFGDLTWPAKLTDLTVPIIIGEDANYHHTVWGSTNINSRGNSLLAFVSSSNLQFLNNGHPLSLIE